MKHPKSESRSRRTVIYCRVSSSGQEDNSSLATQEECGRAYAAEHGWTVIAVYREVHTGIELFERPELTLLRESMRRKEFDVLLVYALDRLSRKQTHQGLVLSEAEYAGVQWDSVTEDIDNSPQGQILRAVIGGMAEMERLKISERTSRGRLARVNSGKLMPGSKPPYGYQWRDGTKSALDLDPLTAPVIRRAFEEIAAGGTMHGVIKRMRESQVPTATGSGMWHIGTLREMLIKPMYCGNAFAWGWRKRTPGNPQQFDREKAIALPPGTVPAIVSDEVWNSVQTRLTLNQQRAIRNARNPESALLRGGYARCGTCGRTLSAREHADGRVEYACVRGSRIKACPGCSISARRVDTAVWSRVTNLLLQPSIIASEIEHQKNVDTSGAEIAEIDRQLAEVGRQQANVVHAITVIDDSDSSAPLTEQLVSLRKRKASLLSERDAIATRQSEAAFSQQAVTDFSEWCNTVAVNLDQMTWSEKRLALDALGVKVKLFPHKHEPRYVITAEIPMDVVSRTT